MKRFCSIACALLVLLAAAASADVPELLSYQGVLTDDVGSALPDGSYNVEFRLYTVEAGGTPIWQEAHLLTVTKGIFNATLGWTQPLGALDFDQPYYLGISVEGEAELSPRTLLTDAAYAMNARTVKGSAAGGNIFPASGNVGIGTTSPSPNYALHVVQPTGQVGFRMDGYDGNWASIYVNAVTAPGKPNYGYMRQNILYGSHHVGSDYSWNLILNNLDAMHVEPNGWTTFGGIGLAESMNIPGGLRIGTTTGSNAGTLRWTGTDFEGYDGSSWKSLTSTGGGSLPAGTTGQTLWHNGSDWAATSSLYNNSAQIGIGTTDPEARLDIVGSAAQEIKVETSSTTGRASLTLKSTGGDFDYLELHKHGPSAGGSTAGTIPLANLSRLSAGTLAGPLMLQVISANPMYFVTGNLERMRLTADGNLGINTTAPGAKLHVDGNQWDLTSTEGDFKIGDATYRLKFGVATEGGGAGTAGIRVAGGAEKLILGAGSAEVLSIDGAGVTSIGGSSSSADLKLYRIGVASPVLNATTSTNGGSLNVYQENGAYSAFLQPDVNGEGGYLSVTRNATGNSCFSVDGNYNATNEPRVSISGSAQSASFQMDQTGNASVVLPSNAVAAAEILDEPGVASYTEGGGTGIFLSSGLNMLASRTIVAPAAGYVLVVASWQGQANHTTGIQSWAEFGVSASLSGFPGNQDVRWLLPSSLPTGTYDAPMSVHGLFQVAAAGSYTYYLLGEESTGDFRGYDFQLTLLYVPTSYGTVQPTLAGAEREALDAVASGSPLGEAFVAAQRAESEAANAARIERELAAMRAELEAVKAQLENR
ncbi:MAG: hypothetical protein PHQ19_05075 [Candidatus Krumholzibacteria bacterium]|nr:hypothetical protein [Candidatus Krumholzibacteria bacterium]